MKHCSEFEFDSLLRGRLDWKGRLACLLHLAICPQCRSRYRQVRNDESFIISLRESVVLMDNADFDARRIEKNCSINVK